MGHSTLNVRSKCLTSSIFFKFCGQPHMAIKLWHANFEKNWTTFRALLGHFAGVTFSVPKNGPKRPQFSKCSSYIKNAHKIFFFILKYSFWSFLFDEHLIFQKKIFFSVVQGVQIFWSFLSGHLWGKKSQSTYAPIFLKICQNMWKSPIND